MGGAARLDKAVEEGRVKKTVVDGIEFFGLRSITVGTREEANFVQRIERKKMISDTDFKKVSSEIKELGWDFPCDLPSKDTRLVFVIVMCPYIKY